MGRSIHYVYSIITDYQNSVIALLDPSTIHDPLSTAFAYDPFGKVRYQSNNDTTQALGWLGRQYDSETGNNYLINRYYNADRGSFLSPDRYQYVLTTTPFTFNLYQYGYVNPLRYTDPEGLYEYEQPKDKATYVVLTENDFRNMNNAVRRLATERVSQSGAGMSVFYYNERIKYFLKNFYELNPGLLNGKHVWEFEGKTIALLPTAVFVHGYRSDAGGWKRMTPELSIPEKLKTLGFTTLMFDYKLHNLSGAVGISKDFYSFLKKSKVFPGKFDLYSHSFGNMIARYTIEFRNVKVRNFFMFAPMNRGTHMATLVNDLSDELRFMSKYGDPNARLLFRGMFHAIAGREGQDNVGFTKGTLTDSATRDMDPLNMFIGQLNSVRRLNYLNNNVRGMMRSFGDPHDTAVMLNTKLWAVLPGVSEEEAVRMNDPGRLPDTIHYRNYKHFLINGSYDDNAHNMMLGDDHFLNVLWRNLNAPAY